MNSNFIPIGEWTDENVKELSNELITYYHRQFDCDVSNSRRDISFDFFRANPTQSNRCYTLRTTKFHYVHEDKKQLANYFHSLNVGKYDHIKVTLRTEGELEKGQIVIFIPNVLGLIEKLKVKNKKNVNVNNNVNETPYDLRPYNTGGLENKNIILSDKQGILFSPKKYSEKPLFEHVDALKKYVACVKKINKDIDTDFWVLWNFNPVTSKIRLPIWRNLPHDYKKDENIKTQIQAIFGDWQDIVSFIEVGQGPTSYYTLNINDTNRFSEWLDKGFELMSNQGLQKR